MKNIVKILAVVLFTGSAFAGQGLVDQFSGQGYGDAGCGLGSVLFGSKKGAVQIFAATTNGTSGNQTFGITSGTSNCSGGVLAAQLNNYVESNKIALSKDAARGEGETLAGLTQVIGCKAEFGSAMKNNYKEIFSNDNTQDISNKIIQVAKGNPGLCS